MSNALSGTSRPVIPRPGDVLKIHEDNYRYGVGELVLRVTAIGGALRLDDGDWLTVVGIQIAWNGADVGELQVAVRLSRLIPQRRRP